MREQEKIQKVQKGNKRFEGEGGSAALAQERADGPSSTVVIQAEGVQEVTALVGVRSPEVAGPQQKGQL